MKIEYNKMFTYVIIWKISFVIVQNYCVFLTSLCVMKYILCAYGNKFCIIMYICVAIFFHHS
jgi:hypothetical protein